MHPPVSLPGVCIPSGTQRVRTWLLHYYILVRVYTATNEYRVQGMTQELEDSLVPGMCRYDWMQDLYWSNFLSAASSALYSLPTSTIRASTDVVSCMHVSYGTVSIKLRVCGITCSMQWCRISSFRAFGKLFLPYAHGKHGDWLTQLPEAPKPLRAQAIHFSRKSSIFALLPLGAIFGLRACAVWPCELYNAAVLVDIANKSKHKECVKINYRHNK